MKKRGAKKTVFLLAAALAGGMVLTGCQGTQKPDSGREETSEFSPVASGQSAGDGKSEDNGKSEDGGKSEGSGQWKDSGWPAASGEKDGSPEISFPQMDRDAYPQVDGSTATLPLSVALYQEVTGASEAEAESQVVHTKTTNAYLRLIAAGEAVQAAKESKDAAAEKEARESGVSLVLAYEPAEKVYEVAKEAGVELEMKAVGKDALVFLTNENNPVKGLTGQQLVSIYSGRMKNWSQAGGAKQEIRAFQRPAGSGSQTLMEKLVMKGTAMKEEPMSRVIGEMGELLEKVASYNNRDNALGYSVYFYAKNMYEIPGLRFMEVDGVAPSNETIRDGSYPYVNEFYAVIHRDEPEDSEARRIFDWLTSRDGQRFIEELGYVSLRAEEKTGGTDAAAPSGLPMELPLEFSQAAPEIPLEEGERIFLDGQSVFGLDEILILNGRLETEQRLEGVEYPAKIGIEDPERPLILRDRETGKKGIYQVKEERWLAEPVYESLYEESPGCYHYWRYLAGEKQEEMGTIFLEDQGARAAAGEERVGEYLWAARGEDLEIRDLTGRLVRTLEAAGNQGYVMGDFYILPDSQGNKMVLDETGEMVFRREMLGEEFLSRLPEAPAGENVRMEIVGISGDGSWLEGYFTAGSLEFIYDLRRGRVVNRPEDFVDTYYWENDAHFILSDGGPHRTVYGSVNGKVEPIRAANGHDFDYIFGGGYFAYEQGRKLIVEKAGGSEHYELDLGSTVGIQNGNTVAPGIFYLYRDNEYSLWRGEQCLMRGSYVWYSRGQGCVCVMDEEGNNLILREEDGEIFYRSPVKETVLYLSEQMLAVRRGNYIHFLNGEGETVRKLLEAEMSED